MHISAYDVIIAYLMSVIPLVVLLLINFAYLHKTTKQNKALQAELDTLRKLLLLGQEN